MTKTETVVRLLKNALADRVLVSVDGDFRRMSHCYVPVRIGGAIVKFWMRGELRRVEEAIFADGSTADSDVFDAERWLPPSGTEFSHWWRWMDGYEHATPGELEADEREKFQELRAARDADDWPRRLRAHQALVDAAERFYAWDPLHYLSDDEKDVFEAMLRNASFDAKTIVENV